MPELLLNRYAPIYEAGSGGFGSVVVAYDTNLQREVAVKCIPLDDQAAELVNDRRLVDAESRFAGLLRRNHGESWSERDFAQEADAYEPGPARPSISLMGAQSSLDTAPIPGLEEARAAAHLNDANIVSIYDFQVQDGMAYLIMEYLKGVSVGDIVRRCPRRLDADVIAVIFKAVAHALTVAHANHVLHLDIKPDNVLITPKGQVKVVDFGLARLGGEGGFGAADGGTIGYMPPEQMRQEELDERCDEWALASLTYHMISGSNPFLAPDLDSAEDAIYGAEVVLPSLCQDGLDPAIDDILFCALEPYRDDRYDTVKGFAKELQPCLGDTKEGKRKLKTIVGSLMAEDGEVAEELDEEPGFLEKNPLDRFERLPHVDFVDRISPRATAVLMRVWALICVAVVAFVGTANFTPMNDWSQPATWGIYVIQLIAAVAIPHVGALLALEFLGVSLILNQAIAVGVVLMVATLAWWFFVGRFGHAQANVVLSVVPLGAVYVAAAAPLVAGWLLRPKDAAISALMQVLVAFAMGGLGSKWLLANDLVNTWWIRMWTDLNGNYLSMVTDPGLWSMAVAWALAALAMALFCARGHKALVYVGAIASALLYAAAMVVDRYVATGGKFLMGDTIEVASLVMSCALVMLLGILGCPDREGR